MIKFTSIQAENSNFYVNQITSYIGTCLGIDTEFVVDIPWQEREQLLYQGGIHVGWICGLPYVVNSDQPKNSIELLAAPVMQNHRYQNHPIYFSDVIVHYDSEYKSFSDLRGLSWAYNEPHSHSGYNLTKYHLAMIGETRGYFGDAIEAGSHQAAIDMVINKKIHASAIDSTVLEMETVKRPDIRKQIRIIDSFGPSPIPPWVIQKNLPTNLKEKIRDLFLNIHLDSEGNKILVGGQIKRFVIVEDSYYNEIRYMSQLAKPVKLSKNE